MYLQGFSLNNLSWMALIVGAGLVVDDAIVVLENISRHIERGLSPFRAALKGSGEVGFTLLAMTLSLVAVFVSILFMGGLVERLFREFSITLAAAMLVSLVVSLTLTPSLCARLLAKKQAEPAGPRHRAADRTFDAVKRVYARSLGWVLQHATLMLLILIGTVALNVAMYITIPKGFLSMQDTGQLMGFARGDDAFSYQVMQPKIDVYRNLILADPAVQDVIGFSGGQSGISNSRMMVRPKPLKERKVSASDVVNRIRENPPPVAGGALFLGVAQDLDGPRMGDGGSYDLTLMSSDLELLRQWVPKVSVAMQELPELTDVDAPRDGGTQQVRLDIDREAARRLGVDMQLINSVLNNSFSQRQVATLYDRLNQYRVVMEVEPRCTSDPSVLDQVQVIAADGSRVPLSAFTRRDFALTDDRVRHRSQFAAENVGFSLAEGVSLQQALDAIDAAMAKIMLPTDVVATMSGGARSFQTSRQNAAVDSRRAGRGVSRARRALRKFDSSVDASVDAALGGARCAAGTAADGHGVHADRAARIVSVDRHRDEERDFDDRFRDRLGATRAVFAARRDFRGRVVAAAADPDDELRGGARCVATGAGRRRRRGDASSARARDRGRAGREPVDHALHRAGGLSLVRSDAATAAAQESAPGAAGR